MVTGKGHWSVVDGHTSGGHASKSVSLSVFNPILTPKHPQYLQSISTKQRQVLKTSLPSPLCFFLSFFPRDFLYLFLLLVFPTAWDPNSWHVRASWPLNIITLSSARSYLSYSNIWMTYIWKIKSSKKVVLFLEICSHWFSDTDSLKNVIWELSVSFLFQTCNTAKQIIVLVSLFHMYTYDPVLL